MNQMRLLNLEDYFSDKEQSAAEKLYVVAKVEAAKASKTDTNLDKFNCNQCTFKNSFEKGLTQHIQMKHCPSVEFI